MQLPPIRHQILPSRRGWDSASPRAHVVSHVPPVAGCLERRNWAFAGTRSLHPRGAAAGSLHQWLQGCRWFTFTSADFGCNRWLFELVLPHTGLQPVCPVWPLTLDICGTFSSAQLSITGSFMSLYGTVRCEPQKKVSLYVFISPFVLFVLILLFWSLCPEGLPPSTQVSVCARVTYFHQLMLLKHSISLSDLAGRLRLSKMLLQVWEKIPICPYRNFPFYK